MEVPDLMLKTVMYVCLRRVCTLERPCLVEWSLDLIYWSLVVESIVWYRREMTSDEVCLWGVWMFSSNMSTIKVEVRAFCNVDPCLHAEGGWIVFHRAGQKHQRPSFDETILHTTSCHPELGAMSVSWEELRYCSRLHKIPRNEGFREEFSWAESLRGIIWGLWRWYCYQSRWLSLQFPYI